MKESEKLIKTNEEAIDCLKKNKPTSGFYMLQESVDMAIKALEKQVAKKPSFEGDGSCKTNSKSNVSKADKDNKDKDNKDKENKENVTCKQVVDLFHSICTSYPSVKTLSEARKKDIKARLKAYSIDDFRTLFEKAEASAFLKGSNDWNWTANFDWLIKDANMAKVIDGNYDNKGRTEQVPSYMKNKGSFYDFEQRNYDYTALEKQLTENSGDDP